MKRKRNLLVLFLTLLISTNVYSLKVKVYTLKELITESDVIVVALMGLDKGAPLAKVQKALKGNAEKTIKILSTSFRDTDVVEFEENEKVILFLGPLEEKDGRRLIGYGDQAKWPKNKEKWPYSKTHIAPIQKVEFIVTELLKNDTLKNPERQLLKLIKSNDAFYQMIALEYLASPECKDLQKKLHGKIVHFSKSENEDLRKKAVFISSLNISEGCHNEK